MSKYKKKQRELFWEKLKKPYLTTEQKLEIIREYNRQRSDEEFKQTIKELEEYLAKRENKD